ncbi:MAG TPA: patatin-like phospholipase family protein [Selenomonadales bacterium]|nr:patatin-like phospholipase family protein [Selenomonadales bacterium]
MSRPRIGLALGSGGLRGLAHIGVLRVLEEAGIPIDFVAGCSIGSLVGGLYAAGLDSETILKLAKNLKRRHWLDFVIPKMGLVAGDRTLDMLRLLTQRKRFEDLAIPFAVVAAELNTGDEVVFTEGEVAEAIRASISVPGVFVPFKLGDKLLVDGAVVNPTPMDIVHRMGADLVIAIDLVPTRVEANVTNIFDVMIQTIDIVERQLFKHREQYCDVLVRPDVAHISPSSFEAVDECVTLGVQAMAMMLPEVKRLMGDKECSGANGKSQAPPAASAD